MGQANAEYCDLIRRLAGEAGFELCGIGPADPMPRASFFHEWLARGYAGTIGYLRRHKGSRVDVRVWLPWARSVIVVGMDYGQSRPEKPADEPRGRVAMYAWGQDYHRIMKEKLRGLAVALGIALAESRGESISPSLEPAQVCGQTVGEVADGGVTPCFDPDGEKYGEKNRGEWNPVGRFRYKICVDTSAITERELAAAAGIGWIGKNTLILNETQGSYFFLGEIITDMELPPDPVVADHCGSCTRCLDACPTQAFPKPYVMDASRCISYLTIEHRKDIEPALAAKMGDWIYGCDICQDVCPYNRKPPETGEDRLRPFVGVVGDESLAQNEPSNAIDAVYPPLSQIESWDDAKLAAAVSGKASERAMLKMWKRNAAIVRENLKAGPADATQ